MSSVVNFISMVVSYILSLIINIFIIASVVYFLYSLIKKKNVFDSLNDSAEQLNNDRLYGDNEEVGLISRFKIILSNKYILLMIFIILGIIYAFTFTILSLLIFLIYKILSKVRALSEKDRERLREKINSNYEILRYYSASSKHIINSIKNNEPIEIEDFKIDYMKSYKPVDLFSKEREADLQFKKAVKEKATQAVLDESTNGLFNEDYNADSYIGEYKENLAKTIKDNSVETIGFDYIGEIGLDGLYEEESDLFKVFNDRIEQLEVFVNKSKKSVAKTTSFIVKFGNKDNKIFNDIERQKIIKECNMHKKDIYGDINKFKTDVSDIKSYLTECKESLTPTEYDTILYNLNKAVTSLSVIIKENHLYTYNNLNNILKEIGGN